MTLYAGRQEANNEEAKQTTFNSADKPKSLQLARRTARYAGNLS
ncbi:hypothetical protein QUB76_38625 [Microcoleus sp. D2B6]